MKLVDGGEVMVESLWDRNRMPSRATIAQLEGRRVEVVGLLHGAPPREMPANFGFPCISPVDGLRVLAD